MSGAEIWHQVRIKAPAAAVYDALTRTERLAQWWIPDTRGESRVGGTLAFWFSADAAEIVEVVAMEPDRLVRWEPGMGGMSDWRGTQIEFTLAAGGDRTTLQFRHFGWSQPVENFPYYSYSWAVFLASLKDLLETGAGSPFPNRWVDG